MQQVRVWDGFVRLFHWLLVALLVALWWTAENLYMDWHQRLAFITGGLVIARVAWGFIGSQNARFTTFLKSPRAALQHMRELRQRQYQPEATHNPVGGWAVALMLLLLLIQFSTGLFATDDIFFSGPLNALVSGDTASVLTTIHETNFNVLLGIIGVHIVAIAAYKWLGIPLVAAMIHGKRELKSAPELRHGALGIVLAAVIIALLFWLLY
ncbi:MAG TPA: cytochrome b/b6 domain-containing protein [Pseudidiomarina sp.]|nr:cytochrome b/b6 domain-containing protein [Pseudidiomarina sp.]